MNRTVLGVLGSAVGGVIGYVTRPSAPLIGQLPFQAVISRGRSLQGFDQILMPLAQQSFNYLLTGILIGAACGVIAGHMMAVAKVERPSP